MSTRTGPAWCAMATLRRSITARFARKEPVFVTRRRRSREGLVKISAQSRGSRGTPHRTSPWRYSLAMTLVVLTGATRGIGRAAALELARQGAEVALVGREPERVSEVAREAQSAGAQAAVHEHVADLTSMAQVRALAEELRARYERIDVLANNAGALFASRGVTSEGFERTFALNHLAPFLLT